MSPAHNDHEKEREAERLTAPVEAARALARKLGLAPYPVNYWVVDHDEMNELIAYDGFQRRYPHWRWGMKYDRQRKKDQFGMGKAFEIVNNDDPSNAFLQESNSLADQKAVITHVEAHADFFRNNEWFRLFLGGDGSPAAAALLERHADAIEDLVADPAIDREAVERYVDAVTTLSDNIDQHSAFTEAAVDEAGDDEDPIEALQAQVDQMDIDEAVREQVFDESWVEAQAGDAGPADPRRDVLGYLLQHGKQYDEEAGKAVEREDWQTDVLEMLRTEAYYFAPQKMTKVMNEGWACVDPETPIFTEEGIVPMREVVERSIPVSDGEELRPVTDVNVIENHDTVTVKTRRGFELTGSNNHRVRRPDGSWVRLDELDGGEKIEVSGGSDSWPDEYRSIEWSPPEHVTLDDVAEEADVSVWTVLRYRRTGRAERADEIAAALERYEGHDRSGAMREHIRIPSHVDERLGRFLGLLLGDGHVSERSKQVGFTSGSQEAAVEFAGLADELFDVNTTVEGTGSRWRAYVYSAELVELLADGLGLPTGKAATEKVVPEDIKRSPRSVVAEFLRGLFDADGYAGDQGAILSTASERLSEDVQLLLTNFDVLSRRREQQDGCYHVHLTGASAKRFQESIGFGYDEKDEELGTYLDELDWFEDERWTTEVSDVSTSTGTVYDITVEKTHRYAGGGFVNHNSYWESRMMTGERFAGDDEFLTYADHMARVLGASGLNPYALGMELWEYVENRTNRREVVEKLLRVDGVTWRNFHDAVDFDEVRAALAPDDAVASVDADSLVDLEPEDPRIDADALAAALDGEVDVERYPWQVLTYEGLAERHYSLARPQNRGFLERVSQSALERRARYLFETERYPDVAAALADVDYAAGWDRMREVRESHNDVTFIDEFLTQEFVTEGNYFAYEYSHATEDYRATGDDVEQVKKKLLLQFTNFGKPTIVVQDGNFANRGELLLAHQYNGVALDLAQAEATLERVFGLWGRPVNLATIVVEYDEHELEVARRQGTEPEGEEVGTRIRYDGEEVETHELDDELRERIAADDVDYGTKPEDWLA